MNKNQKQFWKYFFYITALVITILALSKYAIFLAIIILPLLKGVEFNFEEREKSIFLSHEDILKKYPFWKVFSIIYYIILLSLLFSKKLESENIFLIFPMFLLPFLLMLIHSTILFYKSLK